MTLLALLLVLGLWKKPGMMVKVFVVFGRILSSISCVGLLLQGVKMIFGWEPIPGMGAPGRGPHHRLPHHLHHVRGHVPDGRAAPLL